ncbi:MAG: hypothetical protein ABEJ93_02370 [Candidatus Nanohalobium sp.]
MRVEKLLKRLRREFIKVNIIQASLDSIGLFLILNIVTFFFSIRLVAGYENAKILAPLALIFFVGDLIHRTRNYRLEIYEEENPELREILRTARDNLEKSDVASQALFDDLIDRARKVTSDSIVPSKVIIQKILVVGALSFLTALSGMADLQIQKNPTEVLKGFEDLGSSEEGGVDEVELKNGTQIIGESQNIDASMNISVRIRGGGNTSERGFYRYDGSGDTGFTVSNPRMPENLELARKYSEAIKSFER